ncbi:MAG: multicopper oxidase domain-containing protein [Desulfobaccales bacterium]
MMTRRFIFVLGLALGLALPGGVDQAGAQLTWTQPVQNPALDYSLPNYAYSPILTKFVDPLPLVGTEIPLATQGGTVNGDPVYYIGLKDFTTWKFHRDLPATRLRGYYQADANGNPVAAVPQSYLGPVIVAERDKPIRVKFFNKLPAGAAGNLFLPVDTTVMGAGQFEGVVVNGVSVTGNFTQNRAAIHLHGGNTPWVSDGIAHQWITPANDPTAVKYPKGLSFQNVPDMSESVTGTPNDGVATLYYPNQQSARLMFYHDHAYGITRLNVYAGEAAGYLLTDSVEQDLISAGVLPGLGIPLIIQDKTFVNTGSTGVKTADVDPTWQFGAWGGHGQLWFPHVYQPNQLPLTGEMNDLGRWDYGPWFWPPISVQNPMLPTISIVPEAFMDTPIVNGKAYPVLNVDRKAYRFRLLNACNDRHLNLQLYYANNSGPNPSSTPVLNDVTQLPDPNYVITDNSDVVMVPANGVTYTLPNGKTARVPGDTRFGGVPDPRQAGPAIIQIGNEGGFLPQPAILNDPPAVFDFDRDPKSATYGFTRNFVGQGYDQVGYTLLMGPAERADIIIDFSNVPEGSHLILYNDAPAAMPLFDRRYDLYTGNPDFTANGGPPTTQPGQGPNTRTIMKFVVGSTTGPGVHANLASELNNAYKASHTDPVYDPTYLVSTPDTVRVLGTPGPGVYADNRFGVLTGQIPQIGGQPVFLKTITEDFSFDYGRMNAMLGTERTSLDPAGQNAFGFAYIDPTTEDQPDGQTQVWVIIHNGIDTHAIHFHLFNVQIINRLGWDNTVRPPDANELGWKETIRVNALEHTIVAVRPKQQKLKFGQPNSVRPMDVTMPIGSSVGFMPPFDPLAPLTTNQMANFGHEYVWHCHLLGHEEHDMMRPIALRVPTQLPGLVTGLSVSAVGGTISWNDPTPVHAAATLANPANEVGFIIQRSTNQNFKQNLVQFKAPANATAVADRAPNGGKNAKYYYRVAAYNASGTGPWSATVSK